MQILKKALNSTSSKCKSLYVNLQKDLCDICNKFNHFSETNLELGKYHLNKGNLSDALFRFLIVEKTMEFRFEAIYEISRIKVLNNKKSDAILFLKKNVNAKQIDNEEIFNKSKELLEILEDFSDVEEELPKSRLKPFFEDLEFIDSENWVC